MYSLVIMLASMAFMCVICVVQSKKIQKQAALIKQLKGDPDVLSDR